VRVKEIMAAPLISVGPDVPLREVARLLVAHRITGMPVIDDAAGLIGVVSQADVVREEQAAEAESLRPSRRLRRRRKTDEVAHRTAADVMSVPALTVEAQSSAVRAAWLMTEHDVNRLVVVDAGVPVGIVTRTELIAAFARSDEDVRAEIVSDVLPALDVSPNDVEVTIDDGEVVLSGDVEDELQARWLPHAVRCVLGVVSVESRLRPRHDYAVDLLTPRL
jgi:CBS domain-containing protein